MKTQKQNSNAAPANPISPANQMGQAGAKQRHLNLSTFENSPILLPTLVRTILPRRIKHDGWWIED